MTARRWLVVIGFMAMMTLLGPGCSQVDLDSAAPQAAATVRSMFPDATLVKASSEYEGDLKVYEATLKQDDRVTEVLLTSDGTVIEVEKEIDLAEAPSPVAEAVRNKVGSGELTKLEEIEVRARVEAGQVVPLEPRQIFYEAKYHNWGIPGETKFTPDGTVVAED